jgi:hypothetical protein
MRLKSPVNALLTYARAALSLAGSQTRFAMLIGDETFRVHCRLLSCVVHPVDLTYNEISVCLLTIWYH